MAAATGGVNRPAHIDKSRAIARWHRLAHALNANQPLVERIRRIRLDDGSEGTQTYYTRPKLLSDGAVSTGTMLICQFIDAYHAALRIQPLHFWGQHGPALATNNVTLSKDNDYTPYKRHVSSRAIQTHIRQLQDPRVRLIVRKVWHGTSANYELWINPAILWISDDFTGENTLDAVAAGQSAEAPEAGFQGGERTNLPLSVSWKQPVTNERESGGGGKPTATAEKCAEAVGPAKSGNLAFRRGAEAPSAQTGATGHGAAPAGRSAGAEGSGEGRPAPGPQWAETAAREAVDFWMFAQKWLYPNVRFTPEEMQKAVESVAEGVFGGFRAPLPRGHVEGAYRRVELVAEWLKRNPSKYLPMPFGQFVAGTGYFDAENTRGFAGTAEWLVRDEKRRREQRGDEAVRAAQRVLRQWKAGTLPVKLAHLAEKSLPELYRYLESKVRTAGGDTALPRFYILFTSLASTATA